MEEWRVCLSIYVYSYCSHDAKVNHSNIVTVVLISRASGREYKSRAGGTVRTKWEIA